MRHPVLLLAALAAALLGARLLLAGGDGLQAHAPQLVRVADAVRPGDGIVAALSVEPTEGGPAVLYVRSRGLWRCLSAWGAPCDGERVERLVLDLLGARGVVRAAEPRSTDAFGLEASDALELALHGKDVLGDPDGDELLRVRFGAPSRVAGAGATAVTGVFARVAPGTQVLELDLDPRAALGEPAAPGLPPLLAAQLVPADFPPPGGRVERLFLDRADGTALELVRRAREARAPGEGVPPAETLDWEWLLVEGEDQRVIPPLRGEAYVTWLPRAPYVGLADPDSPEGLGLERPQARLTLVSAAGELLELEVGAARPDGAAWVSVPSVPLHAAVEAAVVRMLLPDADELTDDTRRNRWDEALRAALAATRR